MRIVPLSYCPTHVLYVFPFVLFRGVARNFSWGGFWVKMGPKMGVAEGVASPRNVIFPLMGGG
jgi:hypothetical protein